MWSTLSLTLHADGPPEFEVLGASRFPRHWIFDGEGRLAAKSGLTDFRDWYRKSFGKHTPWGDQDSPALITAVETALERSLSVHMMDNAKPKFRKLKAGETLVTEGEEGTDVFLVLDGVMRVEKGGERLAEYGPGAVLGERAGIEAGTRNSTLVAVTGCRVAVVAHELMDKEQLRELAKGHGADDSDVAGRGRRPSARAGRLRSTDEVLDLGDEVDRALAAERDGNDLQVGHAGLAEGGDPLGHVALGPAQRRGLEQLVGHQRLRLGLLAVEVEVLDLLGLLLEAVAAHHVVVEVLPLGPHPPDVEGDHGPGQVAQCGHLVTLADGHQPAHGDLQRPEGRVPLGRSGIERRRPTPTGPSRA